MPMTKKRKEYLRSYMREYRKQYPDRAMETRVRCCVSLLRKLGYTVTEPEVVQQ